MSDPTDGGNPAADDLSNVPAYVAGQAEAEFSQAWGTLRILQALDPSLAADLAATWAGALTLGFRTAGPAPEYPRWPRGEDES